MVFRARAIEPLCVLIVAAIMKGYAFVTCHRNLHQKVIFTVHKLYDDMNESWKPPQRRPQDLWDSDLTLLCLALAKMETTLEKRLTLPTAPYTCTGWSLHLEVEATRTQLSGSIPAAAGLGCQSHRGAWPRTSDTTKRIQLFNTAPKIFCAYSIHPLTDRLNRGILKVDSITRK